MSCVMLVSCELVRAPASVSIVAESKRVGMWRREGGSCTSVWYTDGL